MRAQADQRRAYRVEYQGAAGDGHVVVQTGSGATSDIVAHAHELLLARGVEARIRRIVPIAPDGVTGTRSRPGVVRVLR